jgi:hypothetical protein
MPATRTTSYSCPEGYLPCGCPNSNRNGPTTVGNYYYIQSSWTNTVAAYPSDSAQFQTRRWKVHSSSLADYPRLLQRRLGDPSNVEGGTA